MHNTDDARPPKRLAVPSRVGAQAELDYWLAENRLKTIRDRDGLEWHLAVAVDQTADAKDPKGLVWRIRLKARAKAQPTELVATGVLDAARDARLIELLGEEPVELSMKPLVYIADNEESARLLVADELPKLRQDLASGSLLAVKRQLVGRLVDERGWFDPEVSTGAMSAVPTAKSVGG